MDLLASVRKYEGVKQSDMAAELGITQSAIAKFEARKTKLGPDTLAGIARRLGINPDYLDDETQNPFKAQGRLIKMLLPEAFVSGIDYSILYFLAERNAFLKVLFLVAPSGLFRKILAKTAFENLIYAIAVEDSAGNFFLFRRKANYPLVGDRELQMKMSDIAAQAGTELQTKIIRVGRKIAGRIADWTIERTDIEPLFRNMEGPLLLTTEEKEMIRAIRERKMRPAEVEKLAKTLKSKARRQPKNR